MREELMKRSRRADISAKIIALRLGNGTYGKEVGTLTWARSENKRR
jgi:hypothetical protein